MAPPNIDPLGRPQSGQDRAGLVTLSHKNDSIQASWTSAIEYKNIPLSSLVENGKGFGTFW